jgi:hypothetical protein
MCTVLLSVFSPLFASAKENILSVDESGAIRLCYENSDCKNIFPSGDLKKAIDDGYEHLSIVDIYRNGISEVAATSGGSDECSRFFLLEPITFKFSEIKFSAESICNYRVISNHLISSYKLDARQHEDIYELKNGAYQIALSDDCVGCDQVARSVYNDGKLSEKLLVTNQKNYAERSPIKAIVETEKAWLYSDHLDSKRTKMYLIQGDVVRLIDFADSNGLWYFMKYTSKTRGEILGWVKCQDLSVCK